MRDVPPTSSTVLMPSGSTPADRSARRSAPIVSTNQGRIIRSSSSRVMRTSACTFAEQHGDRRARVGRQRLLGFDAVRTEPSHARLRHRIVGVETVERATEGRGDVREDGFVDVDPAEVLDAFRCAEDLEAVLGLAQDGGVERAAAEVVDRDRLARLHSLRRRVVDRRRFRLAQDGGLPHLRHADGLTEQVELVGTPVGRMRHGHVVGRATLHLDHVVERPAQHLAHERLGRHRRAAEEQRRGVADPSLELPSDPSGLARGAAVGGVARQDLFVFSKEHDGRHDRSAITQGNDRRLAVLDDRRGGVRRADVDAEPVGHWSVNLVSTMLFEQRFWPLIADGSVTLTFRRWRRCQAIAGRRYRTPGGIIEVEQVDVVGPSSISDRDAQHSGFASATEVVANLRGEESSPIYRVQFHIVDEPDPRAELAASGDLTEEDRAEIDRRLDRLDRASSHGPWTRAVLEAIAAHPATRAAELAAGFGREMQPFKIDVRKLKNLGLTISLEKGYRLSPRGESYLSARAKRRTPSTS